GGFFFFFFYGWNCHQSAPRTHLTNASLVPLEDWLRWNPRFNDSTCVRLGRKTRCSVHHGGRVRLRKPFSTLFDPRPLSKAEGATWQKEEGASSRVWCLFARSRARAVRTFVVCSIGTHDQNFPQFEHAAALFSSRAKQRPTLSSHTSPQRMADIE
ncbi:hypothetical protein CAOG_08930, partial [Capsaspora owczarzaki ATCC 30864]|uniref:hypothetical protein n=1 Tax=Capsaspora owczarzaki (strain ATCC 30864) TaxID=595528 RepID=UPI0003523443